MRKIILPIIVLMLANIGFATESNNPMHTQCAVKNGKNDDELKKCKEEARTKINMFKFNTSYISEFVQKVENAKSTEEINKIYQQAKELNDEVSRIRGKLNDVIDYLEVAYPENETTNNRLYEKELDILNQAKTADEAKKAGEKIFSDPEIKKYENESMLYKSKDKYNEYLKGYIKPFYYKNNNIFDSYNDDIFFDLRLGGDVSNSNFLSSLTLGGAYRLKKANVKLGGFVQYDYEISHNISLGTSVVYDNFLGFVRYRLATYKGKINHNVDVFGKYYYEFKFNKLKIVPTVSLYTTVSSKLGLIKKKEADDKAKAVEMNDDDEENTTIEYSSYLLPRIGFDLNLGTKVSYDVLKNLSIFTEPTITVSYNNQRVIKEKNMMENKMINNEKEIITINRSYFGYDINFGVEYKEKGVSIKPILRLTGDMLGNVSLNTNLGIGYKF